MSPSNPSLAARIETHRATPSPDPEGVFRNLTRRVYQGGPGAPEVAEISNLLASCGKTQEQLEQAVEDLRTTLARQAVAAELPAREQTLSEAQAAVEALDEQHAHEVSTYEALRAEAVARIEAAEARVDEAKAASERGEG